MGRALNRPLRLSWLADAIGRETRGPDVLVHAIDAANEAGSHSLCFARDAAWCARAFEAAVLLARPDDLLGHGGASILSPQPRLDFARLLSRIEERVGFAWSESLPQIHPSAILGQHVVIAPGVRIGANTVVGHHVVIGAETTIGARCRIKSGAVIGEGGFGFERDEHGVAVRLPHLGRVLIGDDVEIGSLATVCRGTLGDTVLRAGAKVDDHVHIAHNVQVGEHAFVIACAEVSGGARIGARAWIAPNASVRNQLSVGDDAVVGLGAVVVRSVAPGATVAGNPARPLAPR